MESEKKAPSAVGTLVVDMTSIFLVAEAPWVRNDVLSATDDTRYEIVEFGDPTEAIEGIAAAEAGSVAVVDMQVGSMGGMAICRAIREVRTEFSSPPVPTILLLDRPADAFLARRAGAAGWVLKPFTAHELRSALEGVVEAISAGMESQPGS